MNFQSHSDTVYSIRRIIADGKLVAVHSHAKFTADDYGLAVIDFLRVEHCKIAEHWDGLSRCPKNPRISNGMF